MEVHAAGIAWELECRHAIWVDELLFRRIVRHCLHGVPGGLDSVQQVASLSMPCLSCTLQAQDMWCGLCKQGTISCAQRMQCKHSIQRLANLDVLET